MKNRSVSRSALRRARTLTVAALAATSLWLSPRDARATVCDVDPSNLIGTPISAATHLGSLLTGTIGLATSDAPGWRTASIVIASLNYAQSAAMLTIDALVQPTCGDAGEVGPFNGAALVVEGLGVAGATALLVGAVLSDAGAAQELGAITPYAAPVEGGAVVGVVARF